MHAKTGFGLWVLRFASAEQMKGLLHSKVVDAPKLVTKLLDDAWAKGEFEGYADCLFVSLLVGQSCLGLSYDTEEILQPFNYALGSEQFQAAIFKKNHLDALKIMLKVERNLRSVCLFADAWLRLR